MFKKNKRKEKPAPKPLMLWFKEDVLPDLLRRVDEQEEGAKGVLTAIAETLSEDESLTAHMYGDVKWDCPLCGNTNETSFMSEHDSCGRCGFTASMTYDF